APVVASAAVAGVRFPNFQGKHAEDAVFSPAEVIERHWSGRSDPVPEAVVLIYQRALVDELHSRELRARHNYAGPFPTLWFVDGGSRNVAVVGGFGIGAPAATMV